MDALMLALLVLGVMFFLVDHFLLRRLLSPLPLLRSTKGSSQAGGSGILRLILVFVVSLTLLVPALYVIAVPSYADDVRKWAMGVVGVVAGYWLGSGT